MTAVQPALLRDHGPVDDLETDRVTAHEDTLLALRGLSPLSSLLRGVCPFPDDASAGRRIVLYVEPGLTLRDAAQVLAPMNPDQIRALILVADVPEIGRRPTRGRPAVAYDAAALMRAHAEESARTAKGFADWDWLASALLARHRLRADTENGAIWWPSGERAETLLTTLYGVVRVGRYGCMAHRLIWIASDGEIPAGLQINHRNSIRFDNRRCNLELVTFVENIRHGRGQSYLNYHQAAGQLAEARIPLSQTSRDLMESIPEGKP